MKTTISLLAALAMGLAASAQAAHVEATITVKLTGSYTEDADPVTKGNLTTESGKIVTYRITNKEVIEAYYEAGLINNPSGWKLMLITDEDGEVQFILRKPLHQDVEVTFLDFESLAETESYKYVWNNQTDEDVSFSGTFNDIIAGTLEAGDYEIEFNGKVKGSYASKKFGDELVDVNGAITITVLGTMEIDEDDPDVIEGTLSASAGKVVGP